MARGGFGLGLGAPARAGGGRARRPRRWPPLIAGLALLGWLVGALPVTPAGAQNDPFAASAATVNVELILDVSGSMGELVPGTNQTRMEAAQEALLTVIDQIPERPGLNVGLRVYGQAGSNREADQAVSCASTQLLVPVAGVDRGALATGVQATRPTGWTPLALALEDASFDFAPGESITNAVIMVTDGEETCGGDPCAVAGALRAEGIALTTHVVGFALTAAQEEAVRCIADNGGGQLFAAADAGSLADAVFTAFNQVDVAPALGGSVVGNAFEFLGPGTPGALAVVAAGLEDEMSLLLVVANDTETTVENVGAEVVARRGEATVGSGTTFLSAPYVVPPGGVALLQIYFPEGGLEATDDFDVTITQDALGTTLPPLRPTDLLIDTIAGTELGLEITQRNPHGFDMYPNQAQWGMCFDATGTPHHYLFDTTVVTRLAAGTSAPELIADYRAADCPYYLAAAGGDAEVDFDELTEAPEAALLAAPAAPAQEGPDTVPAPDTAPVAPNQGTAPNQAPAAPDAADAADPADAPAAAAPAAPAANVAGAPATEGGAGFGQGLEVIAPGVPGELSVAAGVADTDTLLLVIQNNTVEPIENLQLDVTAQLGAASVRGQTIHVAPYVVPAGGVALAEIFFGLGGLSDDAALTIDIATDPFGTTPPANQLAADLAIDQVALSAVGAEVALRNPYDFAVGPNQYLYMMCFDQTGRPDHFAFDTEVLSEIPAGGATALTLADPAVERCTSYLVVVTGEPPR